MQHFEIKKGLDLPMTGQPEQTITDSPVIQKVAVLGHDYIGLKPRLEVAEGDKVSAGSPIFAHKDTPDVKVTSPVAGVVKAVNRGARRLLISVEIEVDANSNDAVDFSKVGDAKTRDGLATKLSASGLWTSFKTRPYSKVPASDETPDAIFVTAMDTEPLCGDANVIIAEDKDAFADGLSAISLLSDGNVFVCQSAGQEIVAPPSDNIINAQFSGQHPAGLAGTHMHFLAPPSAAKTVWTIGYHDVISIGKLVKTGTYNAERIIALSGPLCSKPRLVKTIAGASLVELFGSDVNQDMPVRMISGSVLSGHAGEGATAFLGRYARQATLIEEDKKQIPLGWIRPMGSKFAVQPVLGSAFAKKLYALSSNLNGGRRAMVPLGTFENLMPQDYLPTQLLRALLVMDTDQAQALGALELDEEDLALVTFACPAKYEYGMALRDCLTKIEKEG